MSTLAVTNDLGDRKYHVERATPPRWMWSLTTILGCAPSKALIYHAGAQGMQRTYDLACELIDMRPGALMPTCEHHYVDPMRYADFPHKLDLFMRQRFGQTKEGFIKPPHLLEWGKKADTGSAMHSRIEREIKQRLGLVAPEEYDRSKFTGAQEAGYKKACLAWNVWAETATFTPLASEEVVWLAGRKDHVDPAHVGLETFAADGDCSAEWDYACRIDLAAEIMGIRGIWDVKTGKMDTNGQPYPSMWLQVEAQRRAANARNLCGGGFEVAGIIHVPAAGGPVVVHSNVVRDRDKDFAAFDHLNGYARLSVLGDPNET